MQVFLKSAQDFAQRTETRPETKMKVRTQPYWQSYVLPELIT